VTVDGIVEMTLETRDLEGMRDFYVEAFGLDVLKEEDDRIWLAIGTRGRLGLWLPGEKEFGDEGGRHVHYAISASPGSLGGLRERLEGMGRSVHGPEEHPGGDQSIYFEDPEGNVVEVWDFFQRGRDVDDLK